MTQEKTGGELIAEAHAQFDKWVAEFKAAAENSNLELDVDGLGLIMLIFIYNQEYRAVTVAKEEAQAGQARAREAALETQVDKFFRMLDVELKNSINNQDLYPEESSRWFYWQGRYSSYRSLLDNWSALLTAPATDGQEGVEE